MQTLLVLTDFSEAASYAASYACILARQLGTQNIVLYHSYQSVLTPGEGIAYTGDEETLKQVAIEKLTELVGSLHEQVPQGSVMRFRTDTTLLENINEVAVDEGAELIVMGTTGKGKLEEIVSGSNAIRVCKVSDLPVILVPSQIPMKPVGSIIFACDLQEVSETMPEQEINKLLDAFHVPLSVVHVGKDGEGLTNKAMPETKQVFEWLENYQPAYHDLYEEDTAAAIMNFAKQSPSPLILLTAKKHTFPAGLFHQSITKQLAFHSTVPLLVLRQKEELEPYPVMPLLEI